jgi:chorismate mutase/prephenate dehydratase
VNQLNQGPLLQQSLEAVYREIMSASLALEHDTCITYLGPPSTYTHQAARSKFGSSVIYQPCTNISDVFQSVANKSSDYGVVPIENSTEGAVTHTLDEFLQTGAMICAEIYLLIEHHLLSKSDLSQIRTVYSNPNALGQCRVWLQQNLHQAELVPVTSTAKAAELAVNEEGAAAVCSILATELYDLPVQAKNIQDIHENSTRFLVIARNYGAATGDDKTSIMFSVHHEVGALHKALEVLEKHNLNMTKIESRPSKVKNWEYFFFVDIVGHANDEPIQKALEELERHCTVMKILGSFPRAKPADQ